MTSDPGRRIAFTLGSLLVYRIGCFVPPPGVSRIAVVGTAYLAVVFLIPELVISATRVPCHINVASAMIVVCTILDIAAQVRSEAPITVGGKRS